MTTREINALLALRGISVQQIAADINEDRSVVSATLNYLRLNLRVREKIAVRIGVPVAELFDQALQQSAQAEAVAA
ncbi:MAG: hypothetical protein MSG64_19775 [Pyrinomonadaceae bacterium MAG19_C2-C3]|nr:hypothetical protein [Pyrinomonadaceae bacterium MAG19_C2-C3]